MITEFMNIIKIVSHLNHLYIKLNKSGIMRVLVYIVFISDIISSLNLLFKLNRNKEFLPYYNN